MKLSPKVILILLALLLIWLFAQLPGARAQGPIVPPPPTPVPTLDPVDAANQQAAQADAQAAAASQAASAANAQAQAAIAQAQAANAAAEAARQQAAQARQLAAQQQTQAALNAAQQAEIAAAEAERGSLEAQRLAGQAQAQAAQASTGTVNARLLAIVAHKNMQDRARDLAAELRALDATIADRERELAALRAVIGCLSGMALVLALVVILSGRRTMAPVQIVEERTTRLVDEPRLPRNGDQFDDPDIVARFDRVWEASA